MIKKIEGEENLSLIPGEGGEQKFTGNGPDFDKPVANINASFDWNADTWEKMLGWDLKGGDIKYTNKNGKEIWLNDKLKNIGLGSENVAHIDKLRQLMGIEKWDDFLSLITGKSENGQPERLKLLQSVFYVSKDKMLHVNQIDKIVELSSLFGCSVISNKALMSPTDTYEDAVIRGSERFFDSVLAPYYEKNGIAYDKGIVSNAIESYVREKTATALQYDYNSFINKNSTEAAGRF